MLLLDDAGAFFLRDRGNGNGNVVGLGRFLRDGVDAFLHRIEFLLHDHDDIQLRVVEVLCVVHDGCYDVLSYRGVWSESGGDIRILARLYG